MFLSDGSNGLLKLSSESGDIDVYVGDGASSEVLSQEGRNMQIFQVVQYRIYVLLTVP